MRISLYEILLQSVPHSIVFGPSSFPDERNGGGSDRRGCSSAEITRRGIPIGMASMSGSRVGQRAGAVCAQDRKPCARHVSLVIWPSTNARRGLCWSSITEDAI